MFAQHVKSAPLMLLGLILAVIMSSTSCISSESSGKPPETMIENKLKPQGDTKPVTGSSKSLNGPDCNEYCHNICQQCPPAMCVANCQNTDCLAKGTCCPGGGC